MDYREEIKKNLALLEELEQEKASSLELKAEKDCIDMRKV